MFVLLLLANLGVALVATVLTILAFRNPIGGILSRIVQEPVAAAWRRYLVFALFVVGVSSGVSPWNLERYTPAGAGIGRAPGEVSQVVALSADAWALELYRTAMSSLRGLVWALFLFFGIGLVLSALLRFAEERSGRPASLARSSSDMVRSRSMTAASRGGRDRPPESRRLGTDSRRRGGEGRGSEGRVGGGRSGIGRGEGRSGERGETRGGGEGRGGEGRGGEGRGLERRVIAEPRPLGPWGGDEERRGDIRRSEAPPVAPLPGPPGRRP